MKAPRSTPVAAVDLGASSGRVMLASVSPDAVTLDEVHRFDNGPVSLLGTLHWDALRLHSEVVAGLRAAAARRPSASTRGRSTMACSTATAR
jgi:rhamnulokinase